jgi:hypothetical protein
MVSPGLVQNLANESKFSGKANAYCLAKSVSKNQNGGRVIALTWPDGSIL